MRILLSRSSAQQVIGGAELSARDITRCLVEGGHSCKLITNIKRPEMKKGLKKQHVVYSVWPRGNNSLPARVLYLPLLLALFLHYTFIVLRFRPHIICPQSREDQTVMTLIGKLLRIPVVWRDPGDLVAQLTHDAQSFLQRSNRALLLWSIRNASAIFTLNSSDRERILHLVPSLNAKTISVIASDILFKDYTPAQVSSKSTPTIIIGTISQLQHHKGVDILIDAFKGMSVKRGQSLQLQIVGDGPERSLLEKRARGSRTIQFVGHKKDVSSWLSGFTIYVQPSRFEGWGRTVKEAKFFGLPVIGSNIGGIARQIKHQKTGLLFKPESVEDLREQLELLADNSQLRQTLGSAGQKDALKQGDWHTTVTKQIMPLFESVLRR